MPKFTRATKFNKTKIKNIPVDKPIVYRIQNKKGDELYTGIAKKGRGQDRLLEHLAIPEEKIPGAAKIKITRLSDVKQAKKLEKRLIQELNPKYNIQGK